METVKLPTYFFEGGNPSAFDPASLFEKIMEWAFKQHNRRMEDAKTKRVELGTGSRRTLAHRRQRAKAEKDRVIKKGIREGNFPESEKFAVPLGILEPNDRRLFHEFIAEKISLYQKELPELERKERQLGEWQARNAPASYELEDLIAELGTEKDRLSALSGGSDPLLENLLKLAKLSYKRKFINGKILKLEEQNASIKQNLSLVGSIDPLVAEITKFGNQCRQKKSGFFGMFSRGKCKPKLPASLEQIHKMITGDTF